MATYTWPRGQWSDVDAAFTPMGRQADGWAIHHTAVGGAPGGLDVGRLRSLEHGEMARGYSALAYHRYVVADGGVAEVRPWNVRGAATGGHNDHTLAIVFDGYFHPPTSDQPTEAALDAAAAEIAWAVLMGFATVGSLDNIHPHKVWTAGTRWATACAGDSLSPHVEGPFGSIQARAKYMIDHAATLGVTPVGGGAPPAQPRCVAVASKRTLRRGSSGVTVRTLQNLLRAKGYDPGPTDGRFGEKTEAAVRCFQKASGLEVDGVVGPATWSALGA